MDTHLLIGRSYKVDGLNDFPTLRGDGFSFSRRHINLTIWSCKKLIHGPGLLDGCPNMSFAMRAEMGRIEQRHIDVGYVDAHLWQDWGLVTHNENKLKPLTPVTDMSKLP